MPSPVEMALANALLQTELVPHSADLGWGKRSVSQGEVGATSSESSTGHTGDRMKPAGQGLPFHGMENPFALCNWCLR